MLRLGAPSAAIVLIGFAMIGFAHGQPIRSRIGEPAVNACVAAANSGRHDDSAVQACSEALTQDGLTRVTAVALLINRGAMRLRRKEAAAALADFDAAIDRDAKSPEAYVNRGAALVALGRPGPAVAALTEALSLGLKEPHKAFFNRGAAREALGDARGALEDYEAALAIKPDWEAVEQELARFVRTRRDQLAERLEVQGDAEPDSE